MQCQFLLLLSTVTLMVVLLIPQAINAQMGQHYRGQHYRGQHYRGQASGMMGNSMGHGKDAQTIHQLFAYHDQIHRTVEDIPGGIQAITESDNPDVAALLQTHVSAMYDRINKMQSIPMIGMSTTLPTMVEAADQYQRQFRMTDQGIEIIETSTDPEIVAVIREHAQEVTQFAEQGMPAMMNGRMR
ncbi:MAG TPA: hypothetical protein V6C65_25935 [Allocoleopsis sp.]